jgi:hypothetical protein
VVIQSNLRPDPQEPNEVFREGGNRCRTSTTHTEGESVLGIISFIKEYSAPHSRYQMTIAFGETLQHHRKKYASAIRIYTDSSNLLLKCLHSKG